MKFIKLFTITGFLIVPVLAFSQDFKISKTSDSYPISKQSIIYALPRTGFSININLIHTIITKGIYAEYAEKYLGMKDVPFKDTSYWTIAGIDLKPFNEPDPEQIYTLTFKTFPANIESLFSKNNFGIILDLSGKWQQPYKTKLDYDDTNNISDPQIIDETIVEHVDTIYKTILNDSSLIRVPVFKKQIISKTQEDLIKETAHQIIKTRKNRIKMVRGEYDFHPDAATLRIMLDEMQKQEEIYLSLFQGTKTEKKHTVTYTIIPFQDQPTINLCFFNSKNGICDQPGSNNKALSLQFSKEENKLISLLPSNINPISNVLFYRIPNYTTISLYTNGTETIKSRIPVYQFGAIQSMPISTK
jgi:hypothetical protein